MAAFAVAGIFSSRVTQAGAEVLVAPGICGWLSSDYHPDVVLRSIARDSFTYARTCYLTDSADDRNDDDNSGGQSRSCRQFSQSQIGQREVNTTVPCPFTNASYCNVESAFQLDTGLISSNKDLGINTPGNEQLWYRKKIVFTPINLKGHVSDLFVTNNASGLGYFEYYLGDSRLVDTGETFNFTFQIANYASPLNVAHYLLAPFPAYVNSLGPSFFIPNAGLNRTDADITLFEIQNWSYYDSPILDPLYATQNQTDSRGYYVPQKRVAVLAAVEQHQVCIAPDDDSFCTPLNGIYNQNLSTLALDPDRKALASHILELASRSSLFSVADYLGATALIAPDFLSTGNSEVSQQLPPTQWQVDSESMYNISLALMQRQAVEFASHTTGPFFPQTGNKYTVTPATVDYPSDPDIARLCNAQKIRSFEYASFSTLGIGIVIGVGALIMIINSCLSELVQWSRARSGRSVHKGYEWIETEILQLQRLAVEGRNVGPWNGVAGAVPVPVDPGQRWSARVIEPGEKFGGREDVGGHVRYRSVSREDDLVERTKVEGA